MKTALTCAVLAGSLACSTTQIIARPVTETVEPDEPDSAEWLVLYRASSSPEERDAALAEVRSHPAGSPLEERARRPRLEGDVLQFTSPGGLPREVSLDEVRAIRVNVRHWRGAGEGALAGAIAGLAAGALIGLAAGDDPPQTGYGSISFNRGQKAFFIGLLGGELGGGVGMLLGLLIGHRDYLEFSGP